MKALFFLLLNFQLPFAISLTANLTRAECRPPGQWAFSFKCTQDQVTWVVDALFGKTIYPPSGEDFCTKAVPNRTAECLSQRSITTRDIRLACNTVRDTCQPNGPAEIMHDDTFGNCPSSTPFYTYAYAVYDCLPALRTTDGVPIDYVYIGQTPLPKTSTEKVYLMSAGYDSKGYTTSPVNQCSVRVSSRALSTVRFSVLDLLGQTTAGSSAVSCPYTLSISAASGYSRVWCAQSTWDYFGTYTLDVPANSGAQQVDVSFNAASDAVSVQGRFWILVEGLTSDGNAASIEINSGGTNTATTVRPTPTPAATTPTTTTTTATTATTTTTSPTTTSSTATTTTTTTRTTTNTSPRATSSASASPAATVASSTATTQSRSTVGQPTTIITTISTATTPAISATSTRTTAAATTSRLMIPVTSFPTTWQSMNGSDTNSPISAGSTLEHIASVDSESDPKTSSYVIAVAVGVSFVGIVLLCVAIPVIVCLCMYCSDRKHRSKIRRRPAEPIPADRPTLTREDTLPVRSANPSAVVVVAEETQPTDEMHGEEDYSKIEDVGVTIIHTGTISSEDPSTVEHHIKVRYTVGGKIKKQRRVKGRPRELEQWDTPPPSYADRDKAHDNNNKPSGDPVPKVQRNPIFGDEDYNY